MLNIRSIWMQIIHFTTMNCAGQPTKQTLSLCQEVERDSVICLPPQYVPQRRNIASKDSKEALDLFEIRRDHSRGYGTKSLTQRHGPVSITGNKFQAVSTYRAFKKMKVGSENSDIKQEYLKKRRKNPGYLVND